MSALKKTYAKTLFIFRRDLRLEDNLGLLKAVEQSDVVIPCFIFDARQVTDNNEYRSSNALQFMIESLKDLDAQLAKHNGKLFLFYGNPADVVTSLINKHSVDAVYCNRDYTPFSIARDKEIEKICLKNSCAFEQSDDALLTQPEQIQSGNGTPYSVFTAFFKKAWQTAVANPKKITHAHFFTGPIAESESTTIYTKVAPHDNKLLHVHGGTTQAHKLVAELVDQKNYLATRDLPSLSTTNLSAHLKFGTVSVRTVYYSIVTLLGRSHPLLRQLYWRDFFTHVLFHKPAVLGHAYHEKYDNLPWNHNTAHFKAWCTGTTGFPIVDAGMRQLNATGFMHNRVRMIVGSFLTKDLHIDWRMGEKYFAQQLVDYDPALNNGNWQWVASTGCDAQPYFRIFNPWLQQKKFDPACEYIKKWVPELASVDVKTVHNWFKENSAPIKNYPRPIIDHTIEARKALVLYKSVK